MGWKIFIHSVRLVWANLGVAFRVSGLLYVISIGIQIWAQSSGFGEMEAGMPNTEGAGVQLLSTLISIMASLWIAVAWHRYILLEEVPQGYLPQWHGGRMATYFGRSLLIGLAMIGVILTGSLPMMLGIQGALGGTAVVFGVIFAVFVFYRLCAVLPSAAVGEPISFAQSWHATEGTAGIIGVLVLCTIGGGIILMLPAIILASFSIVIGTLYMVAAQWFLTMFGISIFTTFYGYFVEKRELG